MKRRIVACLLMMMFVLTTGLCAAEPKVKGASDTAKEHASDQAVFNRVGDWFSTIGKSGEEKEAMLEKRRAERALKKKEKEAQKETKKAQKALEKEAKKGEKQVKKGSKKVKKEGKKMKDKLAAMKKNASKK